MVTYCVHQLPFHDCDKIHEMNDYREEGVFHPMVAKVQPVATACPASGPVAGGPRGAQLLT